MVNNEHDDDGGPVAGPADTDTPQEQLRLSGQQRELAEGLARVKGRLANMYLGALAALADPGNPDRLPQAAHSIRELMEKLPEYIDGPLRAQTGSMNSEIRVVEDQWMSATKMSRCFQMGQWQGDIDPPLRRLLDRACKFFDWLQKNRPRRRVETANALRMLDASKRSLPPAAESMSIEAWTGLQQFFIRVSHHRGKKDEASFRDHLTKLESFLLVRLRPRPLEDFEEIDSILAAE